MKQCLSKAVCVMSTLAALLFGVSASCAFAQQVGEGKQSTTELGSAPRAESIASTMVLGATVAGNRIVAVGEEGAILLSDDGGKTFRQAKYVPADSTLTSVTFVDDKDGWAAGHSGVILHTVDGGETWALQRSDTSVDQPIFGIAFKDKEHGWAVGLWSLMLKTDNGGKMWQTQKQGNGASKNKGGINLYSVFFDNKDDVFATGEQGAVLKSADDGKTWTILQTGYNGSLWTGTASPDGTLYVGGLRGHIFCSGDEGHTWTAVASGGGESSITQLLATHEGIAGVGLDGTVVFKKTGANEFGNVHLAGREALTAIAINAQGQRLLFSKSGVLSTAN